MSSAIKPPGSGVPPVGVDLPSESGPASSVREASRDFRSELDRARELVPSASVDPAQHTKIESTRAELLRALSEDLRAGNIEPNQAIERLIERTLNSGPAASLPPALRTELESLLRGALEFDPSLDAMRRDLARGR
jgi:hypothetical protein